MPNAIQTIVNDLTNLIIYCLNCIRHMKSSTFEPGLSDHELVYCVRKINCKKFPAQTKLFRNYAKYNNEAFCSDLGNVDWEQLCNPTGNNVSVNEPWSNLENYQEKYAR